MPFLRPLKQTAPNLHGDWPISGQAYVAAFMGPIAGGPLIGFLLMNKVAFAIGLPVGIGITLIHAWFSDRYLDPLIEAHQKRFAQGFGWWMVNIVAFAWALILSAFSMMIPWLILGDAVISNGR